MKTSGPEKVTLGLVVPLLMGGKRSFAIWGVCVIVALFCANSARSELFNQVRAGMPNIEGIVRTILVTNGWAYLGGSFSEVVQTREGVQNRTLRQNLAAVEVESGRITEWMPTTIGTTFDGVYSASNSVSQLLMHENTIFAAGAFTNVSGKPKMLLAALDARSGELKEWDAELKGKKVKTMGISGRKLFVFGDISHAGGEARSQLAALDVESGKILPWLPEGEVGLPPGHKVSMGMGSESIYIGSIGPEVWMIDQETGATNAFVPFDPPNRSFFLGFTTEYLVERNNRLYGQLQGHDNHFQAHGWLYCYDLAAKKLVWFSELREGTGARVDAMAFKDDVLYIGGTFYMVDIANGPFRLAAIDINDGKFLPGLTLYKGIPPTPGPLAMAISDNALLIGGYWMKAGSPDGQKLATQATLVWLSRTNFSQVDVTSASNTVQVSVLGNLQKSYQLEGSANLKDWAVITNGQGAFRHSVTNQAEQRRFYRAVTGR